MARPTFGLEFFRVDDQPQPVIGANMDVVGIIGPCSTADATEFPLNTPVLVFSQDTAKLKKLADASGFVDGYIGDAIDAINDQVADFQVAAQIVIVRTPYGTAADANEKLQQTIANIMGDSILSTGVHAFKRAPSMLYCTPRLIMAPGYTGQMANSLDTLVANVVGVGYIPNQEYTVTFAQGGSETNGANLVLPRAHVIANSAGEIHDAQVFIDSYGAWMTVAPTATITAPDGPPNTGSIASGSILFSAQPGIGSTINFGGTSVAFVASTTTPVGNQVRLGPDLADTLDNLLTFLQASDDSHIITNDYALNGGTLLINQKAVGVAGNGFILDTTVTGATLSGHSLAGGSDAASPVQGTLTATIALGANPICVELPGVLDSLIGHAVVESAGVGMIADENWRTTLNHPRLIGVSGGVKIVDPITGDVVVRPLAPRVIGLIVAEDFRTGYPFHSAANRPIQGVVGPGRTIDFNLLDGDCEGQVLLSANLGIIARGLVGVETAISSGGFVFIGTDNLGDDELWRFYNVMRGRDFIHLSLMPALRTYLGRANITRQTVKNVITTITSFLGSLEALEQILGFKVNFRGALNSAEEIRLGHLTVGFAAEEPPVLRRITTMSARYRPAIDNMVATLEQELNTGSLG